MEIVMHKYAIIVAAGTGTRMGGELPKQFQLLKGKPVLWYSVKAFTDSYDDVQLILVLPENHLEKGEQLAKEFPSHHIHVIVGGDTRFRSVKNGLSLVKVPSIVFVHDGVRCLVSSGLIKRCYQQAVEKGSAIPAVTAIDSIRIVENGSHFIKDRQHVRIIQTPQTFLSEIILPAFEQEYSNVFTDEATVVEAHGTTVFLTEGEYDNIKITRPVDMTIAERILEERSALKET